MSQNTLRRLALLPAALLLGWITLRYLLPILTPFLLAALLALAAEPLVSILHRRARIPRVVATGIGVTMTLTLLILILMVLGAILVRELSHLAGIVPDLGETALSGMESLKVWLLGLAGNMPDSVSPMVTNSVENMFSGGTALVDRITAWLLNLASGMVSRLPDSALGIGTFLLAGYMISAKLPALRQWLGKYLPESWSGHWLPTLQRLKKTVSGWLVAQSKLILVTFLVLSVGFFALQIPYALLWAMLICLVDALPILGTGSVLLPWSLVCFLQGDTVRGIGLLGIYAAASLLRSVLEPRLVGRQLGLDPLVTLLAMYTGYRLLGIGGMILAPLLAVTGIQLFSTQEKS